jgi:hypothetical protein
LEHQFVTELMASAKTSASEPSWLLMTMPFIPEIHLHWEVSTVLEGQRKISRHDILGLFARLSTQRPTLVRPALLTSVRTCGSARSGPLRTYRIVVSAAGQHALACDQLMRSWAFPHLENRKVRSVCSGRTWRILEFSSRVLCRCGENGLLEGQVPLLDPRLRVPLLLDQL